MATAFVLEPKRLTFGTHEREDVGQVIDTSDEKQFFERNREWAKSVNTLQREILRESSEMLHPENSLAEAMNEKGTCDQTHALAPSLAFLLRQVGVVVKSGDVQEQLRFIRSLTAEADTTEIETTLEILKQAIAHAGRLSFVDVSQRLDKQDRTDEALDVVFDAIDDACLEGQFDLVDRALKQFKIEECSIGLLIGILTVTAAASSKLANRRKFRDRVETTIRNRGKFDERLLRGL